MNPILKHEKNGAALMMACVAMALSGPAAAQTGAPHDMNEMPGMNMPAQQPPADGKAGSEKQKAESPTGKAATEKPADDTMPGMDHGSMTPSQRQGSDSPAAKTQPDAMQNMDHGSAAGQSAPMQGGRPPPDARDPDAYAEGTAKRALHGMEMADDQLFGRLLVNQLEYADGRREQGQNLNAEAWYGGDRNKLWLKAEGERRGGRLGGLRTEALWDRVLATYWSTQLGIRHDTGQGAARNWLAFGVQGLAPYWFETEATAYWGNGGTLAARAEVKYELLFTQRLILQPKLGANFYSKNDAARGVGSGLSDIEFGLRLRYEIRRQFAPYVGVSWKRKFGNTAEFARRAGEDAQNAEAVAGVRIWF